MAVVPVRHSNETVLRCCRLRVGKRSGRGYHRALRQLRNTRIPLKADIDLDIGRKAFASGLLPELIAALRSTRSGDLVAVVGDEESVGPELETWCRFTGNPLLEVISDRGRPRWVFRCGAVAAPAGVPAEDNRPVGSRLWLYTNFDCNLHCDYCCVRSSPKTPRRELGLDRIQRIASEAAALGVG